MVILIVARVTERLKYWQSFYTRSCLLRWASVAHKPMLVTWHILWILGSWMTTYLGKSCSFGLPRVPFVNCGQLMYLVISLLVLRAGCGIWLYQFLIIAYLFTLVFIFAVCLVFPVYLESAWRRYSYHRQYHIQKNVNRKVLGVPQFQTAANPRHQEEDKMTKTNKYKTNKCTRSTQTSSLFPSEVITMIKRIKKHEDKEHGNTLKHEGP